MFTGIVEDVGKIEKKILQKTGEYLIRIKCNMLNTKNFKLGESIAVNGVCLTVTKSGKTYFETLASLETLSKTNLGNKSVNDHVNLERAMKIGDRLDGHMIQGHVDQIGQCTEILEKNGSWMFTIEHKSSGNITVEKGSIAVNGISLTVVNSNENHFSVAIIPYTYNHTNFNNLSVGDNVNLEFDILGKYIAKMLSKSS